MNPLLLGLAAYRVARFVAVDELTRRARNRIIRWAYRGDLDGDDLTADVFADPDPPRVAYLVSCVWCLSLWVALALTAAPGLLVDGLAAAAVAGFVGQAADRLMS